MPCTIFTATCYYQNDTLYVRQKAALYLQSSVLVNNAAQYLQRHVLAEMSRTIFNTTCWQKCRVLYSTPRVGKTGQAAARGRPRAAREPLIVGVIVQHNIVVAVIGGRCRWRPGRHFVARLRSGDIGGTSWDGGTGHHRSYQLLSHSWSHLNVGPENRSEYSMYCSRGTVPLILYLVSSVPDLLLFVPVLNSIF
jgi:hypothetical protein